MNTTQTAISAAVEPLRSSAIERARIKAAELVEFTIQDQAANPSNYTYPMGMGRLEYATQKARYTRYNMITTKGERDQVKVDRFIQLCCDDASAQYTAFVMKLENKVGDHVAAELTGEHVWGYSVLTVTKADGSKESWKTQMIVNVSVLGKLFNQFPSRKMK